MNRSRLVKSVLSMVNFILRDIHDIQLKLLS